MRYIYILIFITFSFSSSIDLVTTNDLHGFIAEQDAYFMNPMHPPKIIGGSGFYKYIKENINSSHSIILDAGNFFQGHPMSVVDSGKTMIEFMNKIGYTAIVPGPDDFVYGSENLNNLSKYANFPFLISNLKCDKCNLDNENFKSYYLKEIDGVKFGFLGLIDPELIDKVPLNLIKGISIENIKENLDYWVPVLDSLSDVLIILTSTGVPYDREMVYNEFISYMNADSLIDINNAVQMGLFSNKVDLIVSGGVSKGYDIPWVDPNNGVVIMQNYGNGTSFGHVKLNIKNNKFDGYSFIVKNKLSQTLLLDDFDPDIEMRNWINNKNIFALDYLYEPLSVDLSIEHDYNHMLNTDSKINDNWQFPSFGSTEKLDIITWNCEFFPISNEKTIDALSEAIFDLDVDIIAFQEIKKNGWFDRMMSLLPDYEYIISDQSSFMNQAIIYKREEFNLVRKVEPFAENDYNFAGRPPLRADFYRFSDSTYYSVINLHMKCCDSGLERRKNASKMLYKYIINEMDDGYSNFVVLGDWNDDLKDSYGDHCFDSFLSDDRFYFTTNDIVNDISQSTYPKEPYVSFLDHILVTKKLIADSDYHVQTIKMDDYMNGYEIYEKLISDHFPVLLSF